MGLETKVDDAAPTLVPVPADMNGLLFDPSIVTQKVLLVSLLMSTAGATVPKFVWYVAELIEVGKEPSRDKIVAPFWPLISTPIVISYKTVLEASDDLNWTMACLLDSKSKDKIATPVVTNGALIHSVVVSNAFVNDQQLNDTAPLTVLLLNVYPNAGWSWSVATTVPTLTAVSTVAEALFSSSVNSAAFLL